MISVDDIKGEIGNSGVIQELRELHSLIAEYSIKVSVPHIHKNGNIIDGYANGIPITVTDRNVKWLKANMKTGYYICMDYDKQLYTFRVINKGDSPYVHYVNKDGSTIEITEHIAGKIIRYMNNIPIEMKDGTVIDAYKNGIDIKDIDIGALDSLLVPNNYICIDIDDIIYTVIIDAFNMFTHPISGSRHNIKMLPYWKNKIIKILVNPLSI